jgi:hypothetical protein
MLQKSTLSMQLEECFLVVEVMDVPVVTIADLIAAGDQLG